MEKALVVDWAGSKPPLEEEINAWFRERRLKAMRWQNGPHDRYSSHSHKYHKVIFVLSGSIEFVLTEQGERFELGPGDRLELPQGTTHAAEVGGDGVVCLEAHL